MVQIFVRGSIVCVTSAVARDPRTNRPPALATVDGQWINIAAQTDIISEVRRDFRQRRGFSIHVLNLDHLVKRRSDPLYKDAYERATYVTCDGAPVAALARRQFTRMQRTPGPDLIEPLCRLAARGTDARLSVRQQRRSPATGRGTVDATSARASISAARMRPSEEFRSDVAGSRCRHRSDGRQRRAAVPDRAWITQAGGVLAAGARSAIRTSDF